MKMGWLGAALALSMSGAAWAHEAAGHKGAGAPAAAAAAPLPKPKRDPQAYFSDRLLLTQDGRPVRFYTDLLKGRTVVLNTIYTSCQDACPLITAQMNEVRKRLGAAFGTTVFFVTISTDPARDTPPALKKFAAKQGADVAGWTFLTGSKQDVDFVLKRLGQWSDNIESHSTQLIAWSFVTDRGRKMLPSAPAEMIAAQIEMLISDDALVPLPRVAPGAPPG